MSAPQPERTATKSAEARAVCAPSGRYGRRLLLCTAGALGLHAVLLFGLKRGALTEVEFAMSGDPGTVEVDLVAGEPDSAPAAAEPETPPEPQPPVEVPPEPMPPEPLPEPEPEPLPADEMAEPAPPRATPPPRPKTKPAPLRPAAPASRAPVAAGNPATPGTGAGAPGARPGTGGGGAGSTKPGYLSNPRPPYPPESPRAGEQGTVLLRVMVNVQGRADSVSVARSSGFPRLDAAAVEGVRRWRFKPGTQGGAPVASAATVPVRFSLSN